jgi:hypothetical protein
MISPLQFPEKFETTLALVTRAFGTSDLATRLLMLNAVTAGAGIRFASEPRNSSNTFQPSIWAWWRAAMPFRMAR